MNLDEMLKSSHKGRVALVKAEHEESLLTVKRALNEGVADFTLIGDEKEIRSKAEAIGLNPDQYELIHEDRDQEAADLAAVMAQNKEVDVLMKGLIHTSLFTKALLNKNRGLIPDGGLISHFGLFDLPGLNKPIALSDAALNIQPDVNQKKIILENALGILWKLGIKDVKTACIAPVEKVSLKIQSTVDAAALADMDWEGAIVEGPLALDAALSAEAAKIKGIDSRIAGNTDLLIFPDLNSANGVYKAFSFSPGSRNAGILAGLGIPVVLTSRSDDEDCRYLSLRLALRAAG